MKKVYISIVLTLSMFFLLSFHIILTDDGIDIITKDTLTFRDTFADVRRWDLSDYITHSQRIRNYLIYEKHYPALLAMLKENTDPAKTKLREIEEAVHKWLSERLK